MCHVINCSSLNIYTIPRVMACYIIIQYSVSLNSWAKKNRTKWLEHLTCGANEQRSYLCVVKNRQFVPPAGSEAAHHWHHQQERCPAGDGDAGRLQHHHPHSQHFYWGAVSRCLRGITPPPPALTHTHIRTHTVHSQLQEKWDGCALTQGHTDECSELNMTILHSQEYTFIHIQHWNLWLYNLRLKKTTFFCVYAEKKHFHLLNWRH